MIYHIVQLSLPDLVQDEFGHAEQSSAEREVAVLIFGGVFGHLHHVVLVGGSKREDLEHAQHAHASQVCRGVSPLEPDQLPMLPIPQTTVCVLQCGEDRVEHAKVEGIFVVELHLREREYLIPLCHQVRPRELISCAEG